MVGDWATTGGRPGFWENKVVAQSTPRSVQRNRGGRIAHLLASNGGRDGESRPKDSRTCFCTREKAFRSRRRRGAGSGLVSRVLCVPWTTRGNHSSRTAVARRLQQPTRESNPTDRTGPPRPIPRFPLFGFAPGGVYQAGRVTPAAGALLPHRFTLTARPNAETFTGGGLLSVALSLTSRPVDVIDHPVLRSPDFPPACRQRKAARKPATAPPTPHPAS